MAQPPKQAKSKETPKAAAAFQLYVALGPGRSLRKLADGLVRQKVYKSSTVAFRVTSRWSAEYNWQDRIAQASTEAAERMLAEAADLDANTFLVSSRHLNERMNYSHPGDTEVVIKMRESVRKPMPKGRASVSVSVSVEVKHLAEQLAKELGIDATQLISDAEEIANREWSRS